MVQIIAKTEDGREVTGEPHGLQLVNGKSRMTLHCEDGSIVAIDIPKGYTWSDGQWQFDPRAALAG